MLMFNILYFLFDSIYNIAMRYFKPKAALIVKKVAVPDPIIAFVEPNTII